MKQRNVIADYWEEMQVTNNLAKEVELALHKAKGHSWRVARTSHYGLKAIKSLTVDVRDMYESAEILRDLIQELVTRIDRLNDPGLNPAQSIYKMLNDFKTQVEAALAATVEAVTATLNVLKSSEILDKALGDEEDGIQRQLKDMITHLRTGKKPGLEDEGLPEYGPVPTFPLEDCDDDYYDRLKKEATRIDTLYNHKEEMIQRLEEKKVIYISKRDTVDKALTAALEARGPQP